MVAHAGFHWSGGRQRFFEGWYYRVCLPECNQSFAFMYAIDDPQGGTGVSGGCLQVLGMDDQHMWRTLPNTQDFWADRDYLRLGHWGRGNRQLEGYEASDRANQGYIVDPVSARTCRWNYQIQPRYWWQRPTMGPLSYLPIFEPGWQILTAHGLATGTISWHDQVYQFQNVPAYSEKNWGRSFPRRWFWLQANSFARQPDLSLTAAGGLRDFLTQPSAVAMISVCLGGVFYNFLPDQAEVICEIEPWGSWQITAVSAIATLKISAKTNLPGTYILVPTATGLKPECRDTGQGSLELELGDRQGRCLIQAKDDLAALEVGGSGWEQPWRFQSAAI